MDVVGNVLAERREERVPWGPAAFLALLLHAGALTLFVLSALAHPLRFAAPRAVAVRLLPAGSLRAPEPVRAAPAPPAAEKPKIVKPPEEEEPPPSKKAVLVPPKEPKKTTPPPAARPGRAPTAPVSLPSAGEEASGTAGAAPGAGGSAGIGRLRLDQADFKYPVYIERLVSLIGMNWFKPAQLVTTSPVIHFQIERDGTITDPRIVTSSGLPFVDR